MPWLDVLFNAIKTREQLHAFKTAMKKAAEAPRTAEAPNPAQPAEPPGARAKAIAEEVWAMLKSPPAREGQTGQK